MIIGRSVSFIDSKSRLYVSNQIIKDYFTVDKKFILSFGLDKCLYLMNEASWTKNYDRFKELPLINEKGKDYRTFMRFLTSNAIYRNLDYKNRILIPKEFLSFADLNKKIYLIGAGNMLEIWDYSNYEKHEQENRKKFIKIASKIIL